MGKGELRNGELRWRVRRRKGEEGEKREGESGKTRGEA
jgi:hypothetical protein